MSSVRRVQCTSCPVSVVSCVHHVQCPSCPVSIVSSLLVSVRHGCAEIVSKLRARLNCRREVYENMTLRQPSSMDACHCYPPCSDVTYYSTYSLSTLSESTLTEYTLSTVCPRCLQSPANTPPSTLISAASCRARYQQTEDDFSASTSATKRPYRYDYDQLHSRSFVHR